MKICPWIIEITLNIDLIRGEIPRKNGQNIVIDSNLLKSLKYVKEYELVQKKGAEALKIIGEIKGMETVVPKGKSERRAAA